MKKKVFSSLALAAVLATAGLSAQAVALYDYGFNIDGTTYGLSGVGGGFDNPLPAPGVNTVSFDEVTGLGTISITLTGAGVHSVDAFFDHEIDEAINTFFNESGAATGTVAAGQSWEIDEPGFLFGDIFTNFENSALDNSNAVPAGLEDDVSMAMGWDFTLAVDETALIDLVISETAPLDGFYLTHTDPDSQASIYLASSLDIRGGGQQIPAPATLLLVLIGLAALGRARYRVVF